MNKFMAILQLATIIAILSPMMGHAQFIHRSNFKIDKLSTREGSTFTYVDGEITNNAKKKATAVAIAVRWFDKNGKVVAKDLAMVSDLGPGETLPFEVSTLKKPEIVWHDVTIEHAAHF